MSRSHLINSLAARLLVAAGVWVFATTAQAVLLVPGALLPLGGTTSGVDPTLAGVVQQDEIRPFSIEDGLGNVILTGELQERVSRSDATGSLIYSPRIRNLVATDGDAWVMNMLYDGFADVPLDVEYRIDGMGQVGPNSVYRTADGNLLRFNHDPNIIVPPKSQHFLSIKTPAYESVPLGSIRIMAQNDFGAEVFTTIIPKVAVPAFAGDANLDGTFDSADLIQVFMHGEYEDALSDNSIWADGDFNRDLDFNSTDLVLALATGKYESASPAVAAVPEPASLAGGTLGLILLGCLRRRVNPRLA